LRRVRGRDDPRTRAIGADPAGIPGNVKRLVRGIFQQRRKTLLNALRPVAATFGLDAVDLIGRADVDPQQRPGDLPLAGFAALARAVL
jgi:16S rRNA A1518/A1519 N6-dimethyltransferase RsmA/KsgA/DIM1 with predicted DNA glycosylase/AP lyase activity